MKTHSLTHSLIRKRQRNVLSTVNALCWNRICFYCLFICAIHLYNATTLHKRAVGSLVWASGESFSLSQFLSLTHASKHAKQAHAITLPGEWSSAKCNAQSGTLSQSGNLVNQSGSTCCVKADLKKKEMEKKISKGTGQYNEDLINLRPTESEQGGDRGRERERDSWRDVLYIWIYSRVP